MSKPKDPKDIAIAFVMTAPIDVATAFVQTLASVVKARGTSAMKPAAAASTSTSSRSRAKTAEAAAATVPQQPKHPTPPLKLDDTAPLN